MKKSKEYAKELVIAYERSLNKNDFLEFKDLIANVWFELTCKEVKELAVARNVKFDSGLIPILKDQRKKYASICNIVNKINSDLLSVSDFDEVIKRTQPKIYDWYVSEVLV